MSATVIAPRNAERATTRRRTRACLVASGVLHALLIAWLLLLPRGGEAGAPVTEISFLEGGEAAVAAAPAAAPATVPGALVAASVTRHFERAAASGDVDPDPQVVGSVDDQINARLAALQSHASVPSAGSVVGAPPGMWSAGPAVPGGTGSGGSGTIGLARGGGGGGGGPLPMVRGTGRAFAPALAPAPAVEHSEASRPARESESSARRTLAGATLTGPIADRAVLAHATPEYPEWAKREAVEGSVTLYFVVRPDGSVKENVLVERTAGFTDFDENARTALRAWRFEPLGPGRTGEQWGTITFRFRLQNGG